MKREPTPLPPLPATGNKLQISLTIAPDLLRKVDARAKKTGLPRAAVIRLAIHQALNSDIFK